MTKKKTSVLCWFMLVCLCAVVVLVFARDYLGYDLFDRSGWHTDENGVVQYLDHSGEAVVGWQEIDGVTCYFDPQNNGELVTGWLHTDEAVYFLRDDGAKTIGWQEIDGARYYFGEDGAMHCGWLSLGGETYYFSETGAMQTGLVQTEDGLRYLAEPGKSFSGWLKYENNQYYINEDGMLHTGWLTLDGASYYLTDEGTMHTGWLEIGEDAYYFTEDGTMAVGRVEIDGKARYFRANGKYFVLVNRWNTVPEDYTADLVWYGGYQVDASCLVFLEQMVTDCNAAGFFCNLTSGYRSYDYQTTIFQRKVDKLMGQGYTLEAAELETSYSIAIPGTSEHQLGLAIDAKSDTGTYAWLAQNSWKYGYILRYPYGETKYTGIYYEPWHFRYVGREFAAELYESGLCVEEYMERLTESVAAEKAA